MPKPIKCWPFFLIGLGAVCSLSCLVTSESSIVGRYTAESPCVTATLFVNADHTFVQRLREGSGKKREVKGHWNMDRPSGFIAFHGLLDLTNPSQNGEGVSGLRAERMIKGIVMGPEIVKCPESSYEVDYVKPW